MLRRLSAVMRTTAPGNSGPEQFVEKIRAEPNDGSGKRDATSCRYGACENPTNRQHHQKARDLPGQSLQEQSLMRIHRLSSI